MPQHALEKTIWAKTSGGAGVPELDVGELETLFSSRVAKPGGSSASNRSSRGASVSSSAPPATALPLQRANNVLIVLGGLKFANPDGSAMLPTAKVTALVQRLSNADTSNLTAETLASVLSVLPTREDADSVRAFLAAGRPQGQVEAFVLAMMEVPRVRAKTSAMRWQAEFAEKARGLESRVSQFTACCEALTSSDKLARILEIILALGNILNRGTKKQASGFKLSSLTKLSDTKASNKSTTLLHYLAKTVEEKSSELLDFADTLLSSLDANKSVRVADMRVELKELTSGLNQLEQERVACGADDAFFQGTEAFYSAASKRVADLVRALEVATSAGSKVREYFGEDNPQKGEASECFTVLASFCHAFGKAVSDNRNRPSTSGGKSERGGGSGGGSGGGGSNTGRSSARSASAR